MVGEVSVGIGKLTALRAGAELLQHVDKESSAAIPRINNDVHPRERPVVVSGLYPRTNVIHQMLLVAAHEIHFPACASILGGRQVATGGHA